MRKLTPLFLSAFCVLHSAFAGDFQPALPGYDFQFPRDHGSHDEYKTEWWYFTGHLRTEKGRRYGFEVTFFRVGVVSPDTPAAGRWDLRNLALAHFAVTDVSAQRFRYYQKLNRASPFTAGAASNVLDVFNEGWSVTTGSDGTFVIDASLRGGTIAAALDGFEPARVPRDGAARPVSTKLR